MKRFGKVYRLQADSIAEVAGEFEKVALGLSHSARFQGRKLRPGPLLNALALAFVAMPEAEREAYARRALAALEAAMEDGERVETTPVPAEITNLGSRVAAHDPQPARRRKRG